MNYYSMLNIVPAAAIIFFIALIVSIVLFFVFLPESKKDSYKGFTKYLYNFFNFHNFWMSTIIKIAFMVFTITFLLLGIYMLFVDFLSGIAIIISVVFIRLLFELSYILYAMRDQLSTLNNSVDNINSRLAGTEDEPEEKQGKICPGCGAVVVDGQNFCANCGTKLD